MKKSIFKLFYRITRTVLNDFYIAFELERKGIGKLGHRYRSIQTKRRGKTAQEESLLNIHFTLIRENQTFPRRYKSSQYSRNASYGSMKTRYDAQSANVPLKIKFSRKSGSSFHRDFIYFSVVHSYRWDKTELFTSFLDMDQKSFRKIFYIFKSLGRLSKLYVLSYQILMR